MEDISLAVVFNSFYLLIAGLFTMVFSAGICMVTIGFIRAKNTTSVLTQQLIGFGLACIVYIGIGYELMFLGHDVSNPYFPNFKLLFNQHSHWQYFLRENNNAIDMTHLFFQVTLVGAAVVIINGIMAERLRVWPFVLFSIIFASIIYPIPGYWVHGAGFLNKMGFIDQTGAGTIFLAAAAAGLAGLMVVGPRRGKYLAKGKIRPLLGANMPLAVLGAFLIWIGSFGIYSGYPMPSQQMVSSQDLAIMYLNASMAAVASLFIIAIITRVLYGKVDLTLVINGVMVGLVALAAAPARVSLVGAFIIGLIAGVIGSFCVVLFDKLKVDDPLGGVAVYGMGAIWSLLAVLITADYSQLAVLHSLPASWLSQCIIQIDGIIVIFTWSFSLSSLAWLLIKLLIGVRIDHSIEHEGLDDHDCGISTYSIR